jgi:hypothetical protein
MRLAHIGVSRSEETRKKISESKKGIPHSKETRERLSQIKKGVPQGPHSKETKEKIRRSKTGVSLGPRSKKTRIYNNLFNSLIEIPETQENSPSPPSTPLPIDQ